jgi:hypothetical protein
MGGSGRKDSSKRLDIFWERDRRGRVRLGLLLIPKDRRCFLLVSSLTKLVESGVDLAHPGDRERWRKDDARRDGKGRLEIGEERVVDAFRQESFLVGLITGRVVERGGDIG